jgi:hypothetical protein
MVQGKLLLARQIMEVRSMRKLALLSLMIGLAMPAFATKKVSVAQLEQIVAAVHAKTDAKAAEQIYELELTERLSTARFAQDKADLPGPLARQALLAVADASAFLDLPAADIPGAPAPDQGLQAAMWAKALDYAGKMLSRLPNFFATRDTINYADVPSLPPRDQTETLRYQPLHEVGNSSATVLYRGGHEFVDKASSRHTDSNRNEFELGTDAAFGSVLPTVLADSAPGGAAWSHWEQGPAGLMAVFRYAVAQRASHYAVTFPGPSRDTHLLPAYHGEVGINPANGSILRLTMVAELKPNDPGTKVDLLVDYGAVQIGGGTYICPVKSVAYSLVREVRLNSNSMDGEQQDMRGPLQSRVNDVVFSQYHLFRAEMRILPEGAETDGQGPAPTHPQAQPTQPNR